MTEHIPAILVAGTRSGCGKTTVALGIMAALRARGMVVQPFKCGPDFIDPTLHQMVTGNISYNLDMRMCGREYVRALFSHKSSSSGADICVVEGVMGLFDGGEGSAATLAAYLGIPVILVVDSGSAAESIAAVVHGFESLQEDMDVAGVVLNRVASPAHARMVTDAVKRHCKAGIAGVIPRNEVVAMPSRHLGLHMGHEQPMGEECISALADLVHSHMDLEFVIDMAGRRHGHGEEDGDSVHPYAGLYDAADKEDNRVSIGVARDNAFCFYYQDNLEMLEAAGARLVEFSPVDDSTLPDDICGLYLGGGYPELYATRLSSNRTMQESVRNAAYHGMPVLAECGGFMYLTESLTDLEGRKYDMAGLFPFASEMKPRLRRLGYREARLLRSVVLGSEGDRLWGHEFHYSDISRVSGKEPVETALELGDGRREGYVKGNVLAGYIHFHWGRTPGAVTSFMDACRMYGSG